MMRIKQTTILYFTGILLLTAMGCSSKKDDASSVKTSPVNVAVQTPAVNTDNSLTVTGQVESALSANISTRVMGYITSIKVKVGDRVSKGQLLVTISNEDILAKRSQAEAMIASADAAYKNAQKDYERFSTLFKQKSATAKELDNVTLQQQVAKSNLQSAQQMKAEANAMLAYTNITAPFSGVISQKLADEGSIANPGMPILVLEQNRELRVSAEVPENEISTIKMNSPATISIASVNKNYSGIVQEISPSSMPTGGQYIVKIQLPAEAQNTLSAGMYATVNIPVKGVKAVNNTEGILIPVGAVQNIGQLNAIYTVSESKTAILRYVRLGNTYGNQVEVLSGLGQGESLITSAEGKLYNGVPVTVTHK